MTTIKEIAKKVEQEVIDIRRTIHANPELAGTEKCTAELIANELRKIGLETKTDYYQYCVTAVMEGNPDGKCILLRADIDALPIQEESGVPFASKNPGIMHACGHDCHAASLLGAAKILVQMKDQINGKVKFIFQPAEEVKDKGANICVDEGVMEDPHVDFAFGTHISSKFPVGSVSVEAGPISSFPDPFRIKIHGVSSHGSEPYKAIDALQAGNTFYNMVAGLVQKINAMEPHVIQINYMHAGTATNICPDLCEIGGTCRTLTPQARELVRSKLIAFLDGISAMYGTTYEFSGFDSTTYPVVNDEKMTPFVIESIKKVIPGDVLPVPGKLGGEDFSCYTLYGVPGVFVHVGTNNDDPRTHAPGHNCKLLVDEGALTYASQIYAQVAIDYLAQEER